MTQQTIEQLTTSNAIAIAEGLGLTHPTAEYDVERDARATEESATDKKVKYVPAGAGAFFFGPGDKVTLLITGEETGGAFFLAEVAVPPGGGVPPHVSRTNRSVFPKEISPSRWAERLCTRRLAILFTSPAVSPIASGTPGACTRSSWCSSRRRAWKSSSKKCSLPRRIVRPPTRRLPMR